MPRVLGCCSIFCVLLVNCWLSLVVVVTCCLAVVWFGVRWCCLGDDDKDSRVVKKARVSVVVLDGCFTGSVHAKSYGTT